MIGVKSMFIVHLLKKWVLSNALTCAAVFSNRTLPLSPQASYERVQRTRGPTAHEDSLS